MSSFAKASFDAAGYLACRPTYPPRIWDIIMKYHNLGRSRRQRALDVGCGPGFAALELSSRFANVHAIDPAQKMVDIGLQPDDPERKRIIYSVGSAEDLAAARVGKTNLIVAAQAAHWFDYPKVWREFTRSVKFRGTVAFIGYAEMTFPRHPELNHLIAHHSRSPEALGNYWQPGRRIVEAHLESVPFPVNPQVNPAILEQLPPLVDGFKHPIASAISEPVLDNPADDDFDFSSWDPTTAVRLRADIREDGTEEPWLMRKTFTRSQLEGYFRTWSALHSYHEAHPDDLAKKGRGNEGDIVDRVMEKIWAGAKGSGSGTQRGEEEVEVGWPLVLMMIQKKVLLGVR